MKKFLLPALAATLLLAATAVAAPLDAFKGMKGTLDIAGGTAHIPVMKEAAKRIMTANPDIRITVAGGGHGGGDITAQQAADIYNGKITNWKELGGTDAPITLYTREDGSGTREVFVERALNKGSIVQSANVVNSNGAMKTAVAQDKQSIGYVGIGHVDKNVKALVFDKMVPSQENASNGTYKVTRLLFMNTKGAPEGITKAFIDYIYTPEGTEIIKKSGYIPTGRQ